MTNILSNASGYIGTLVRYITRLAFGDAASAIRALCVVKMGLNPTPRGAALLECWSFFRYLQKDKRVYVNRAAPNEFRVNYTSKTTAGGEVEMILRMPASASSDSGVFEQIFLKQEYFHVMEWFAQLRENRIDSVLDIGANIGCAALFFGISFPKARIHCVEPEAGNYKRLELNLEMNPRLAIDATQAAIWTHNCKLHCVRDFRDKRESAFRFVEAEPGVDSCAGVDAFDIQTLVGRADFATVDLLKLDVEGAEADLLKAPGFTDFLRENVERIAVEIHEEFISIAEARSVLQSLGFETGLVDEFVVGIKHNPSRT